MSENIWNVMTPFADVAELGQGYMGRADGERLWVPLSEPAELEGEVAFVIYLIDGTPAFAGSGRCIQVADQGEAVDPQVRFEALLDTLVFDERSQPVYDYIVAVRAAAEQAAQDDDSADDYAEDAAPVDDDALSADGEDMDASADYAAVTVDQTVEYGTQATHDESADVAIDDGGEMAAYGQPEDLASGDERQDQTPVGALEEGMGANADHAAQQFGDHASEAALAEEGVESQELSYGEDAGEYVASDAPGMAEGVTDPGFAEPDLLDPQPEATAPGVQQLAAEETAGMEGAHGAYDGPFDPGTVEAPFDTAQSYDASADAQPSYDEGTYELQPDTEGYEGEGYGAEEGADGLELPVELAERLRPSARPAEAAVETVMTPSIMPIATGILSRPAIALHFQPVRARGPARSAATGLFEYPEGELPKPSQLPMPAGY